MTRTWCAASAGYFLYVLALAVMLRGVPRAGRGRAALTAAAGLVVTLSGELAQAFWLRALVLPVAALLLAYRATGFLWRGPMPRIEAMLTAADVALGIPAIARRAPRVLAELFELAYVGVYPLIPLALALHVAYAARPDADWFWAVILTTDYACFAMLPWIQTRPPRSVESGVPWDARLRKLNLGILNTASIRMNTLPSGHAAEALACALVVLDAPAAVVAWMFFNAAAISAGAVFGRYHYTIDVVTGWGVALVVWRLLG